MKFLRYLLVVILFKSGSVHGFQAVSKGAEAKFVMLEIAGKAMGVPADVQGPLEKKIFSLLSKGSILGIVHTAGHPTQKYVCEEGCLFYCLVLSPKLATGDLETELNAIDEVKKGTLLRIEKSEGCKKKAAW